MPNGKIVPVSVAFSGNTDYLYTGKESQNALFGINWYDSGARFQTTDGIFTGIDPLAEKYYHISPYAYCAGNPVNVVDPDGGWVWAVVGGMAEYGMQVYKNYKKGYSGADAWIKRIDVLDVSLSAVNPLGKGKILGTVAVEAVKATMDVTIETGISREKPIEQVANMTRKDQVAAKLINNTVGQAPNVTMQTATSLTNYCLINPEIDEKLKKNNGK